MSDYDKLLPGVSTDKGYTDAQKANAIERELQAEVRREKTLPRASYWITGTFTTSSGTYSADPGVSLDVPQDGVVMVYCDAEIAYTTAGSAEFTVQEDGVSMPSQVAMIAFPLDTDGAFYRVTGGGLQAASSGYVLYPGGGMYMFFPTAGTHTYRLAYRHRTGGSLGTGGSASFRNRRLTAMVA